MTETAPTPLVGTPYKDTSYALVELSDDQWGIVTEVGALLAIVDAPDGGGRWSWAFASRVTPPDGHRRRGTGLSLDEAVEDAIGEYERLRSAAAQDDEPVAALVNGAGDTKLDEIREDVRNHMNVMAALHGWKEHQGLSWEEIAEDMNRSIPDAMEVAGLGGDPRVSELQAYARALGRRITLTIT